LCHERYRLLKHRLLITMVTNNTLLRYKTGRKNC
jgi:hypothetical protein